MRVLLFVQTGDGRVKCLDAAVAEPERRRGVQHMVIPGPTPALYISSHQKHKREAADRWWLVECENAEAGRHCISGGCEPYKCHRPDGPMSCRILASGGKG